MSRQYLTCAETAKLVRQALKETFPTTKFAVRSKTYAGGASIRVVWTDGPASDQVKKITDKLEGSYFDGMIDYKGSRYHALDGQPVSMGADFIFADREYSPELVKRAIAHVCITYGLPDIYSPEQYKQGELHRVMVCGSDWNRHWSLENQTRLALNLMTFEVPQPSPTLARITFEGDDGGLPGYGWKTRRSGARRVA